MSTEKNTLSEDPEATTLMPELVAQLWNAESALRALGDPASIQLANPIGCQMPRPLKLGGVVLTPAGRLKLDRSKGKGSTSIRRS